MEFLPSELIQLRDLMREQFSEDELRDLCFALGIEFDNLGGSSIGVKSWELVLTMRRHGRLEELVAYCRRGWPSLDWPVLKKPASDISYDWLKDAVVTTDPDWARYKKPATDGLPERLEELGFARAVKLRLDAALPGQVQPHVSFELAVAFRQTDSPVLKEEDLVMTKSGDLQVEWPEEAESVALRAHVSAPECQIYGNDSWSFRLKKGEDSPVHYFQLTPQQAGRIGIVVTVFQEQEWLGGMRLQTKAQEQVAGKVAVQVYSHSFDPSQDIQVMIADFIRTGFNPDELRQLCFALNVEYDDLPGETHTAKTRELVKYMVRRNRFADLLQECQKQRPFIGWENWANITTGQRARM
ncbi:MAG: hypothetical protein KJ069_30940 [Anaerolineae bacterium]|nr:hypothetical protein [Anaerolineae bacterium]